MAQETGLHKNCGIIKRKIKYISRNRSNSLLKLPVKHNFTFRSSFLKDGKSTCAFCWLAPDNSFTMGKMRLLGSLSTSQPGTRLCVMQCGQDSLVLLSPPSFGLICVHPRTAGQLLIVMLPLAAFERPCEP